MNCIILAGGKNSRIKTNKAFLKLEGRPFIEIIIDKIRPLFDELIIVTNFQPEFRYLGVKLVSDIILNKGSLGGIFSGLSNSAGKYNFVIACDMPFVNIKLIKFMMRAHQKYDVIIPNINNCLEPLFAIYSKNCIKFIFDQLKRNDLKIINFFSKMRVKEINCEIIRKYDADLLSFYNINTRSDYLKAKNIFETAELLQ